MEDFNNKPSKGFFSNALGVAKKLSESGIDVLKQKNTLPKSYSTSAQVIEGTARVKPIFEPKLQGSPQQMLRSHLPDASKQLLGKHAARLDRVASFIAPGFADKISDYLFDQLDVYANKFASAQNVVEQAGARNLAELSQDLGRSARLSGALTEQNKWIASLQGVLTGATGNVGMILDVPASLLLSLRVIYQIGRSYGFELDHQDTEEDIVQFVFQQTNFDVLTEKHAILLGLKAVTSTLKTHDVYELQQLIGSSNDVEALRKWLFDTTGQAKWSWVNRVPQLEKITKLAPLAGASISAVYNWRLIEEVSEQSRVIFSQARAYLQEHPDEQLTAKQAYEKSLLIDAHLLPNTSQDSAESEKLNVTKLNQSESGDTFTEK